MFPLTLKNKCIIQTNTLRYAKVVKEDIAKGYIPGPGAEQDEVEILEFLPFKYKVLDARDNSYVYRIIDNTKDDHTIGVQFSNAHEVVMDSKDISIKTNALRYLIPTYSSDSSSMKKVLLVTKEEDPDDNAKLQTDITLMDAEDVSDRHPNHDRDMELYYDSKSAELVDYQNGSNILSWSREDKSNLIHAEASRERKLVLFLGLYPKLPILTNHMGYITKESNYIAPYMVKEPYNEGKYMINIGPIFGFVEITDLQGNFFLSFHRDYITGNLIGPVMRTTFIPMMEEPSEMEYPKIVNKEKLYVTYYSITGNGCKVSDIEYNNQINVLKSLLNDHLPRDISNDIMKYIV